MDANLFGVRRLGRRFTDALRATPTFPARASTEPSQVRTGIRATHISLFMEPYHVHRPIRAVLAHGYGEPRSHSRSRDPRLRRLPSSCSSWLPNRSSVVIALKGEPTFVPGQNLSQSHRGTKMQAHASGPSFVVDRIESANVRWRIADRFDQLDRRACRACRACQAYPGRQACRAYWEEGCHRANRPRRATRPSPWLCITPLGRHFHMENRKK